MSAKLRFLVTCGWVAALTTAGNSWGADLQDNIAEIDNLQEQTNHELDHIQILTNDVEDAISSNNGPEAAAKLCELDAGILRWELDAFALDLAIQAAALGDRRVTQAPATAAQICEGASSTTPETAPSQTVQSLSEDIERYQADIDRYQQVNDQMIDDIELALEAAANPQAQPAGLQFPPDAEIIARMNLIADLRTNVLKSVADTLRTVVRNIN